MLQGTSSVGCRSDTTAASRGVDRDYTASSFYSSFTSDISWTAARGGRPDKAAVNCLCDDSSRLSAAERFNDATVVDSERLSTDAQTVTQEADQHDSGRSLSQPAGSNDRNTSVSSVSDIAEPENDDDNPSTRPVKEPSIYDNCPDAGSKGCKKYIDATRDSAADSACVVTNDSAYGEAKDRPVPVDSLLSRDMHGNNNDKEIVTEACQQEEHPIHMNEHK